MTKVREREGVNPDELRQARHNAVIRLLTYGDSDTSSRAAENILKKGRPELGLTARMITAIRRLHRKRILNTPRK